MSELGSYLNIGTYISILQIQSHITCKAQLLKRTLMLPVVSWAVLHAGYMGNFPFSPHPSALSCKFFEAGLGSWVDLFCHSLPRCSSAWQAGCSVWTLLAFSVYGTCGWTRGRKQKRIRGRSTCFHIKINKRTLKQLKLKSYTQAHLSKPNDV